MIDALLRYRPQGRGMLAQCRLHIYDLPDGRKLVKLSEVADNPGMSVTNAAEWVATEAVQQWELDPARCLWVEYDRHMISLITFTWHGQTAIVPRWRYVADGDLDGLALVAAVLAKEGQGQP